MKPPIGLCVGEMKDGKMTNYLKKPARWTRFKNDTSGSMTTIWGLTLSLAIAAIGTGIDLASASRVSTTAQSAADQVALAAAVFYSANERLPETREEGFMHGKTYRGDDAGFSFPNTVKGGNYGVKIRAYYDEEDGEVLVKVWGRTETALMGMFGTKTIKFSGQATAKFKEIELKNPASITLVLDNSGSMLWDDTLADCSASWQSSCSAPSGAEPRIDGLKDSVIEFMDILDSVAGTQTASGTRLLRTGMIPYNSSIRSNAVVDMDWGLLSNSDVNQMYAGGGTNSSPPISEAWDWLQDEPDIHEAENGEDNPLRYMIFMTDGQNSGNRQWYQKANTNYWRGIQCGWWSCWYIYRNDTSRPSIPNTYQWQEGEYTTAADRNSKTSCETMKANGVRVFTIGFALEPGRYMTNYPSNWNSPVATISTTTTDSAYSLLSDCASSGADFVMAEDTTSLSEAFEMIGQTIIQDVIRLSQ